MVKYIRGINLIAKDDGTYISYYLYNAHSDVAALTDGTGAVTKAYTYDAFGNEVNPSTGDTNPFRYCGESNPNKLGYDKETGTIYLRARYYDPEIGRFTSENSVRENTFKLANDVEVADPLSLNRYTYCANNPITNIDPSGHFAIVLLAIFKILGVLFLVAIAVFLTTPEGQKIMKNAADGVYNNAKELRKAIGKRYYGPDGRASKDEHYTNHGNPKTHPEATHEQKWDWSDPAHPKYAK